MATLTPAQQTALNNSYRTQLVNAANSGTITTAQINQILAAAKAAGAVVDASVVTMAQKKAAPNDAKAAAAKQTELNNTYRTQLTDAINSGKLTMAQFNSILADAQKVGAVIDPSLVTRASTTAIQNENTATAAKQTALNNTYRTQLLDAVNAGNLGQSQLDAILADAKAAGAVIDPTIVASATDSAKKYDAAAPERARLAEQAAAAEKAAAAAKLGEKYTAELAKATTQEQLDMIKARAAAEGATLNQGYLDSANRIVQQTQAAEQARVLAEKTSGFETRLAGAQTTAELQSILDEARTAGVQMNQGLVERAQIAVPQLEQAAAQRQAEAARLAEEQRVQAEQQAQTAAQKQALKLGEKYSSELGRVTTQEQLDAIVQQAQAEGAALDPGYLERAQTILGQTQQRAQAAEQQRLQQEYNSALLNVQTPEQVDDILKLAQEAGVELNQGYIDRGRQLGTEVKARADAEAAAAEQARIQTVDFVQNLPGTDSSRFKYLSDNQYELQGPDGRQYRAVPPNAATGEPGRWIVSGDEGRSYTDISGEGPIIPGQQINDLIKGNIDIQNQQAWQQRAEQAAADRERAEGPSFSDFIKSDFGKLLAIAAIAAIAAPYVGSLFSSAAAGEGAAAAGAMAEAGASASEIAAALESAGYSVEAAGAMAEAASGIAAGTIDAAAVAASSSITPEMIALANATADPIAALNAAAGWTAVDTAYLAAIGAPASLIAQAEATNIALGYDPTGLRILSDAETAELMKNVDPDMINTFQPVEPPPGEFAGATEGAPYRVEVSGAAGTAEAPSYAIQGAMNPGTQLATQAQIDAGLASWNPAANAWEIGAQVATGVTEATLPEIVVTATRLGITPAQVIALGGAAAAMAALGGGAGGGAVVAPGPVAPPAQVAPPPEPVPTPEPGPIVPPEPVPQPIIEPPPPVSGPPEPIAPPEPVPEPGPIVPPEPVPTPTPEPVPTPGPVPPPEPLPTPGPEPLPTPEPVPGPVPPPEPLPTPGPEPLPTPEPVPEPGPVPPPEPLPTPEPVPGPVPPPEPLPTPEPLPEPVPPPGPEPIPEPIPEPVPEPVPEPTPPADNLPPVEDRPPNWVNPNPTPDPSVWKALGLTEADYLAKLAAGWLLINGIFTPPAPVKREYGPITPMDWGVGVPLDNSGLNPGYITNVPKQYAPQGVRSQYYWGQKPYQAGTTFDPALYQSAPAAPVQPWGLQQMYNPQTQTINNLLQGVKAASAIAPYNMPGAPKI